LKPVGSRTVASVQRARRGPARATDRPPVTCHLSPVTAVVLFNKPYGVVCQFSAHPARPTLKHFIPLDDVYPTGRLDWDSEGLVVLTADGGLQHRISDPRAKTPKIYWAQVEGAPDEAALHRLRNGVDLGDFVTMPAKVRRMDEPPDLWSREPPIRVRHAIPTAWLELTLREGKNRQVRRMTAAVGHPTLRLIRWRVGPWDLEDLSPGAYRQSNAARLD
jgi:23S rRNA pseudouridine2457 synthase